MCAYVNMYVSLCVCACMCVCAYAFWLLPSNQSFYRQIARLNYDNHIHEFI